MKTRPTRQDDIASLQGVLDLTQLFPSDMLPDMVGDYLAETEAADIWLTCECDGEVAGFCYAVQEELAEGTWNMLAIAVTPARQGAGCGTAITAHLEAELRARGQRILIAETSGLDGFAQTRAFYEKSGYTEEARIRDFWAAGDDKIVFWKSLL